MPTITLQPDDSTGIDSWIQSNVATRNNGSTTDLCIGEWDGGSASCKSLLKFDLSSIPLGAVIVSAVLTLTYNGVEYSGNSRTVQAFRIKRNWVENQVTWNVFSTGNNWQTAGASGADDIESTVIGSYSITASPSGTYSMSLTASLVQEWIDGTFTNNGILLQTDAQNNDQVFYHSSAAATSTNRPKLVIEYILGGQVIIWTS